MSIEAAAAEIRGGLETLDTGTASLIAAANLFDDARNLIAQATTGTSLPEPAQALGALAEALRQLAEAYGNATGCKTGFTDYLRDIADSTGTATTGRRPSPPAPRRPRDDRVE